MDIKLPKAVEYIIDTLEKRVMKDLQLVAVYGIHFLDVIHRTGILQLLQSLRQSKSFFARQSIQGLSMER